MDVFAARRPGSVDEPLVKLSAQSISIASRSAVAREVEADQGTGHAAYVCNLCARTAWQPKSCVGRWSVSIDGHLGVAPVQADGQAPRNMVFGV